MSLPGSQLHGLAWVQETFGLEPRWAVEPGIEAITQTIESLRPSGTVEVAFLAQGTFNKVYNVRIDGKVLIMRISLPVDPKFNGAYQ
ncbi:aminoglycoside phosphotransferase [Aspergillus udagawae]|uniref:Aminoglycoside phosphotransferase n=1 Tax=Aspergillus udagawae TaxID=91492 RepID=A0ABQ1AT04_9EURO|nr:aminoglycoside phosphotransferase [Aspergillus udagawae]GFF85827.1 aminoglycoside phosphotransferase [Aspergillus udagawae]GFG22237.1 aminoglycoside phosphotransferase [Aspergillus udagawae]